VTGISFGSNTEACQHIAGTEADGTEGRLSNFRCLKACDILIPFLLVKTGERKNEFSQTTFSTITIRPEGTVSSNERVKKLRELNRHVLEHPRILSALAREKHRQFAIKLTLGEKTAVGSAPGILIVALEHRQGTFYLCGRLGLIFLQNHDQPTGLLCIKTVTTRSSSQTQSVPRGIAREVLQG
jgi:hypothetical protein